jgi:hypothetical protein
MWDFLATLVGPDRIGGYVRAGVSAVFGMVGSSKLCVLIPGACGVEVQGAVTIILSTVLIGLWSQLAKTKIGVDPAVVKVND